MKKRGQDIKGRATHITNPKNDNTDKIESFVSEVKIGDLVWHASRGWGKLLIYARNLVSCQSVSYLTITEMQHAVIKFQKIFSMES